MGARSRGRVVGTILWIAATGGTSAGDGREIAVARPRERLATVRGVHEAQRARLALLPPAPEEPDVVTTRVAATAAMQAEVEAIDAAEAAGAQPAQLDGAVLAAVGSIVRGGQALAAFEHAVALARIKRTAREGGARVVPGLYFAPGRGGELPAGGGKISIAFPSY